LDSIGQCPVRLVVPHLYFWKSAKWLQSIEFLTQDAPGYWEVRGYHNRGDRGRKSAIPATDALAAFNVTSP
jgi:DMSO/TMAO reductase YedYZ molybdopterin-dependent catalytic subunit